MTEPEAGWYTDPADSRGQRWWTGSEWTADLAPQPAPPHWPAAHADEAPSLKRTSDLASSSKPALLGSGSASAALPGTALLPLPAGHTPMPLAEASGFAPGGTGPRPVRPAHSKSALIWSLAVGCAAVLIVIGYLLLR